MRQSAERRTEVPFVLRLDEAFCLTGRFDLLYRDGAGRCFVLDFKTDRRAGSAAARVQDYYLLQQHAYGLAGARLLGERFAGVIFYFLRRGDEVVWEAGAEAVARAEAHLRAATARWAQYLRAGDFPQTPRAEYCAGCGYRSRCGR